MDSRTKEIRDRLWHSLSPETASVVGLSVEQLQQVLMGAQYLSQAQIDALARHFNIKVTS